MNISSSFLMKRIPSEKHDPGILPVYVLITKGIYYLWNDDQYLPKGLSIAREER